MLVTDIWQQNTEFGDMVASLSWLEEGVTSDEWQLLEDLSRIASVDLELAWTVASLPWFTDGVTEDEVISLFYLDKIASTDLEFAWAVVGLPWFADSMTKGEWSTVQQMGFIASENRELALWLTKLPLSEGLGNHVLLAFYLLVANEPDVVSQIISQPWVQDGLDEEEMAFMVAVLGEASDNSYGDFEALLEGHYTQSKTVSLPLAGDVKIWVFQSDPLSSEEDIPTVIEDIVRIIEGFVGTPLPTTDIIMLIEILPRDLLFPQFRGLHHGSHIKVNRDYGKDLGHLRSPIIHELAHYYRFSPSWFNESFAHLMEGYVNQKMGIQSMAEVRAEISKGVQRDCSDKEIATIRHALFADQLRSFASPGRCTRALGLSFLHSAFEILGEERLSTALRDPYTLHESQNGVEVDEEDIYRALLSNTPPDSQEEFRNLYRRLDGGPYADPDLDRSDDHGDSVETATKVAVGQVVVGALDYGTDFDYFRLQAQENQKYRFEVDHETLRAAAVMIFTGPGKRSPIKDKVRLPSGPLIQWVAPSTDYYYFAVLNWRRASGRYTFRITHVPDIPDDHGDDAETATDISVGETVHGVIDDAFDLDYFRLPVVAGETYVARITGASLQNCCIGLNSAGDIRDNLWWAEGKVGERYIVVHGGHENTGAYTLEVSK